MGNRAQVKIEPMGLYFYTHWHGYHMPLLVRDALAKQWRWNEPSYLARIIFDSITAGTHEEENGVRINTKFMDEDHPTIVVNTELQTVAWKGGACWSFEEYALLDDDNPFFYDS